LTDWGKFIHPPVGRLIWSGTDTAELWASSMDGAVRSGHRGALRALDGLARD
jgi:monoamine oxidase